MLSRRSRNGCNDACVETNTLEFRLDCIEARICLLGGKVDDQLSIESRKRGKGKVEGEVEFAVKRHNRADKEKK